MQYPDGNITVFLNNKNLKNDSKISRESVFMAYVFKRADFGLECENEENPRLCEDQAIFRNTKIDALAFSNEPGFYGRSEQYGYSPKLMADEAMGGYPSTMPPDPVGMDDPDVWQCFYSSFNGGYQCGVNNHPIRYLDLNLSQFHMQVIAADGKGYPSSYMIDYNNFQSLNHPVQDGDRFYMYLAVHYKGIQADEQAEKRFYASSSVFKRPAIPDLISPRIAINIKLLAEGPYDKAGSVYDIPDFNQWGYPGCPATTGVAAGTLFFSEILWAGSQKTDGTNNTSDEFFEIYNNSNQPIVMSGYRIGGMASGTNEIVLPDCATIEPHDVITVHSKLGTAFSDAYIVDSSVSIANAGKSISIKDASGNSIHTLDCSANWGSKGSNGTPKASMHLTSLLSAPTSCTTDYATTLTTDTDYAAHSVRLNSDYAAVDDSSAGTVATPGF